VNWPIALLAALVGYLAGSVSFARLVTRWFSPQEALVDLGVAVGEAGDRLRVSGMGANAASAVLGPRLGCAIGLLDMLKVALPMLGFRIFYPEQPYSLVVAVGGLAGHNWPLYYRFRGGRGFSVIVASFLVVDWLGAVTTVLAGLLLGMVVLDSLAVAYVAWLWLMIPWLWLRTHDWAVLAYAVAMNVLFFAATLPEIRTVVRYRREGRLDAYMAAMMASSPRWRAMRRLADRLSLARK
jgi:glycerol-3-phosphate acyltransferase PlsY